MDYVVEIEGLTKTYPNKFTAISGLTLKVPRGVFAYLGPNGAGKTTTIEILVGAMKPTSGTARVLGHDIVKDSLNARRVIGYLPDRAPAYDHMSGHRFLRYMGQLGGLSGNEASTRALELLGRFGLAGWEHSAISTYSAGMRQRLGLAQSLMTDPEIIFLDEPAANLDPLGKADMVHRVRELAERGKSVFISSHFIPEIEQMADYVAMIHHGQLLLQGSMEDLIGTKKIKEYRISVSGADDLTKELESQGFAVKKAHRGGDQIFVDTEDEGKLSASIVAFCSKHHRQLHHFEPVVADLQTIYQRALGKASEGV